MEIPYEYAYLTAVAFFGFFWAVFFLIKPSVRREMLALSFLTMLFGFFQYFYTHDYWQPVTLFGIQRLDLESFFLAFFYGGVGAALYEMLFFEKRNPPAHPGSPHLTILAVPVALILMTVGIFILGWNSLYVSVLILFAFGAAMILYRSVLFKHALYSGLLFMGLTFACASFMMFLFPGVIEKWWMLPNLSGALISGIPVEELLLGFAWGFFAGPASELLARMDFSGVLKSGKRKR